MKNNSDAVLSGTIPISLEAWKCILPSYRMIFFRLWLLLNNISIDDDFINRTFKEVSGLIWKKRVIRFIKTMLIPAQTGIRLLSIPVEHSNVNAIQDIKISGNGWQELHIRAITTNLRGLPYFSEIEDNLLSIYSQKYFYLIDFIKKMEEFFVDVFRKLRAKAKNGVYRGNFSCAGPVDMLRFNVPSDCPLLKPIIKDCCYNFLVCVSIYGSEINF